MSQVRYFTESDFKGIPAGGDFWRVGWNDTVVIGDRGARYSANSPVKKKARPVRDYPNKWLDG